MDLIDTHQHLIYRDRLGYGWTAGIPALATGDFTVADYQALTAGAGVEATVFMECGVDDADWRDEARMVAELVADPVNRMLGQIASCRPEEDGIEGWLDECSGLHVVGLRRILHVVPDEMSQSTRFRDSLLAIGRRGLPFDLCFLARQLPIARELLAACPDQQFVLDHCGVPDIAGGAFDSWAAEIRAVAAFPNVVCKLSGITAYCAPGQATEAAVAPYVAHVLDCFGADRVLWGGDWPVVNLGAGLPEWITICRHILAGLSEAERQAVAQGTARRVYGLQRAP
jgi:predicted TIM-barrel fold metal-dependent hydrolase